MVVATSKSWVEREMGYQAQREYPKMKWGQKAKEPKSIYSIREWKEHWNRINQVYLELLNGQEEKHRDASFKVFILYKY